MPQRRSHAPACLCVSDSRAQGPRGAGRAWGGQAGWEGPCAPGQFHARPFLQRTAPVRPWAWASKPQHVPRADTRAASGQLPGSLRTGPCVTLTGQGHDGTLPSCRQDARCGPHPAARPQRRAQRSGAPAPRGGPGGTLPRSQSPCTQESAFSKLSLHQTESTKKRNREEHCLQGRTSTQAAHRDPLLHGSVWGDFRAQDTLATKTRQGPREWVCRTLAGPPQALSRRRGAAAAERPPPSPMCP